MLLLSNILDNKLRNSLFVYQDKVDNYHGGSIYSQFDPTEIIREDKSRDWASQIHNRRIQP